MAAQVVPRGGGTPTGWEGVRVFTMSETRRILPNISRSSPCTDCGTHDPSGPRAGQAIVYVSSYPLGLTPWDTEYLNTANPYEKTPAAPQSAARRDSRRGARNPPRPRARRAGRSLPGEDGRMSGGKVPSPPRARRRGVPRHRRARRASPCRWGAPSRLRVGDRRERDPGTRIRSRSWRRGQLGRHGNTRGGRLLPLRMFNRGPC